MPIFSPGRGGGGATTRDEGKGAIVPSNVNDGLIVGSDRFDRDTADTAKNARLFFNKVKGAFRVGAATGAQWDNANVGIYSHGEGENTTASGSYSHAEGRSTTASGQAAHAEGMSSVASGNFSQAGGYDAVASRYGQWARGTGSADLQINTFAARAYTPGAVTRLLTFDGSSSANLAVNTTNVLSIPVRRGFWVRIGLAARNTGADEAAAWSWEGLITRHVSSARMIGTPTVTRWNDATAAGWAFDVSINTTSHYLVLNVTGETGKNINWVARIDVSEVGG